MTDTTQHRLEAPARPAEATERDAAGSSMRGLLSLGAGGLGVVFATLPALGIVALLLAGVAIGVGVPVMRRGPHAPGFPYARVGVVLGMIAVLLGFLSLAIQLLS